LAPEVRRIVNIHFQSNSRWRTAANFKYLNRYNSAEDSLISLEFGILIMSQLIQGHRVKGQGHSGRNASTVKSL